MLKIEGLTVKIGGKEVLSDVNLHIKKGEVHALLGPNGSGKTSLLMTVMGFSGYEVTRGDIFFKGRRVNGLSIDERARMGIGMMFQRPPTIRGVSVSRMVRMIKASSFDVSKEAMSLKLGEALNRDINSGFSGGEIKRSELLQLLASSPDMAMFDEPESGVDIESIALVGGVMRRILGKKKGNTALIITHTGYIFDYVKPDKGCIMIGGRLHCVGDPNRILDTIKKHGYEWCVTCDGEKLKKKKR